MPIIRLFLDITLFQKGPQDVPASRLLLALSVAAYVLVGLVLLGLTSSWWEALLQAVMELALLLGFTWATLTGFKLSWRFLQTATAMLGTDAVLSALALPILGFMLAVGQEGEIGYLLLLLLMLWHLAVVAHILHQALECALGMAMVLAIVYIGGSYQIMVMLFAPSP